MKPLIAVVLLVSLTAVGGFFIGKDYAHSTDCVVMSFTPHALAKVSTPDGKTYMIWPSTIEDSTDLGFVLKGSTTTFTTEQLREHDAMIEAVATAGSQP